MTESGPLEPEDLQAIILRVLAKAPEDRFASMAEVLSALRQLSSGEERSPMADQPTMQF